MNLNRIKYTFGGEILSVRKTKSNGIDTLLFLENTTIQIFKLKDKEIIFNSNYDFKVNGIKINPKNISIHRFNTIGNNPIAFTLLIRTESIYNALISKRNKRNFRKIIDNNKKEIWISVK